MINLLDSIRYRITRNKYHAHKLGLQKYAIG